MPFLSPKVADYMFRAIEGFDVAVPIWPDGTLETLLMALNHKCALEITETLCSLDKPHADSIARGASKRFLISPLKKIKMIDPELESFININSRKDLNRPQTRSIEGKVSENLKFDRGELPRADLTILQCTQKMLGETKFLHIEEVFSNCASNFEEQKLYFWAGVSSEILGNARLSSSIPSAKEAYQRAVKNYQAEAKIYEEKGCRLLAERGSCDAAWCQSRA
jgi:hypothetical protein